MKFCMQCGTQLADEIRFCQVCGAKAVESKQVTGITDELIAPPATAPMPNSQKEPAIETPVTVKTEKKKPKKGKLIAVLCVTIILVGLAVGGYFGLNWYFSDEQQLLRALDSGDFEEAVEIVEENITLRYSDDLIKALEKRVEDILAEYNAGGMEYSAINLELDTIEKMKVKAVSDKLAEARTAVERLNESRTCFATAEKFFASGNYVEAMELYAQVIEEDSNYEAAKAKHTEAVEKYREKVLAEAAQYAAGSSYQNAITLLNSALKNIPNDAKVTEQILIYEKAFKDSIKTSTLSDASRYAEQADYITAMQILSDYLTHYGADVDVELLRSECCEKYVDVLLDQAAQKAAEGNYPDALSILRFPDKNAQGNQRLITRFETYEAEYVDDILEQSNALLEKEKYDEAYELVSNATFDVCSETQANRLSDQWIKIEDARPKLLLNAHPPYESDCFETYMNGRTFKMAGKSYTNGFVFSNGWTAYAYFNLDGNYNVLSFTCGHIDETELYNGTLSLYFDGVLVHELPLDSDGMPKDYEIDITGVSQIKFTLNRDSRRSNYGFADVTIE